MKLKVLPLLLFMFAWSCSDPQTDSKVDQQVQEEQSESLLTSMETGYLRIKVSAELAETLEANTDNAGVLTRTSITRADDVLSGIGVTYLTRTFPYAGRFEARTRAEGLHLWYEVYFDKSESLTRANSELGSIDGVEEVEYRPIIKHINSGVVIPVPETKATSSSRSSTDPFNDPMLSSQWHYNNVGTGYNQVEGSDINLYAAWDSGTVGSSKVIVCVVDTGIETDHNDLSANIWVNEAEVNGTRNVDDDGNGYIDDVYGYSFAGSVGSLEAGDHGTHVAGTISAVNNNNIGVGGIAGGNAAIGIAGVKLMSAEIFRTDPNDSSSTISGNSASAIKYGADNGAVISQNSWGYTSATTVPASDAAAIDYFVQYAGYDEYGNQEGPMAGGVVIFAAGNDELTYAIPGQHESAICVTAIGADYQSAYYTNYGDWADITAPGGDTYKGNLILSTATGNSYAKMQGTSMAAPHVSGVAALIVSKFGGTGFTAEDLKSRLYDYSRDISSYYSTTVKGKMGNLVDASASLTVESLVAPDNIISFSVNALSNSIIAEILLPKDSDAANYTPAGINVYYSTESFSTSIDRENLPSNVLSQSWLCDGLVAGETLTGSITNLEFETTYYVAFDAYDTSRNLSSSMTKVSTLTTGMNNAPLIEPLSGVDVDVKSFESVKLSFKCYDPDGHSVTLKVDPGSEALTLSSIVTDDTYTITIKGVDASEGDYKATLTLIDEYGMQTMLELNYTILPNTVPIVIDQPEDIVLTTLGQTYTIDLSTIFYDDDGESLTYSSSSSASSIAHIVPSSNMLYVTSMSYGNATIELTATDSRSASCTTTFMILIRDPSNEVDLYPNPVTDVLNVRMGDYYSTQIKIYNTLGGLVFSESVEVSPFDPPQLDLSDLSAGSYTLTLSYDNKELTRNIVKL
ncbi:MAG: subtilase family N-terminal domain-containing protein [Rikenellaceae bacterium]